MQTLYKLTDENGRTQNYTQWDEGISHTAAGEGTKLCTGDVIHAYECPLVAVFMNPSHANYKNPILWEAEGVIVAREGQLKCGVKTLTTLRKLDLPTISTQERIEIAIRCALKVYSKRPFVDWADKWLAGTDRSGAAAVVASNTASAAAAYAAAYAAAGYAASAYAITYAVISAAIYAADATAASAAASAAAVTSAVASAKFELSGVIKSVLQKENLTLSKEASVTVYTLKLLEETAGDAAYEPGSDDVPQ